MTLNVYNSAPTTNIKVEGGFDFWSELSNDEPNSLVTDDYCLLTQEPLSLNYITMPCGHKYNYIAICKELSNMKAPKTYYYNNGVKLARNQIFCPYCRKIFNQLLPKIPCADFVPTKYVCSSINHIDHRTCQYIFQSGKRKGNYCGNKNAFDTNDGSFCSQHACSKKKCATKTKAKNKSTITLDKEGKQIWKKYKVGDLKDILRSNSLPVTGSKVILITRLMKSNIKLDLSDM